MKRTSKTVLALLLASTAEAVQITSQAHLESTTCVEAETCVPLTCKFNLERLLKSDTSDNFTKYEGKGEMYKD